jgi:hypothetical protein
VTSEPGRGTQFDIVFPLAAMTVEREEDGALPDDSGPDDIGPDDIGYERLRA